MEPTCHIWRPFSSKTQRTKTKQEKSPLYFPLYGTRKSLVQVIIIHSWWVVSCKMISEYLAVYNIICEIWGLSGYEKYRKLSDFVWLWLIMDAQEIWESDSVLHLILDSISECQQDAMFLYHYELKATVLLFIWKSKTSLVLNILKGLNVRIWRK